MMNENRQSVIKGRLLWLLPLIVVALAWFSNPFAHEMVSTSYSVTGLSAAQRANLQIATQALDGVVLHAGDEFSFNRLVGPRNRDKGYLEAPSYLNGESPATLGGGICLLSSMVYQAALIGGLEVTERVPHLRTIRSIPPGLDATVWYGRADLRFRNTSGMPLLVEARITDHNLTVALRSSMLLQTHTLRRLVTRMVPGQVQVEVFRRFGEKEILVSRDLYRLSP
jgi:vancomycin resistance protein VanW